MGGAPISPGIAQEALLQESVATQDPIVACLEAYTSAETESLPRHGDLRVHRLGCRVGRVSWTVGHGPLLAAGRDQTGSTVETRNLTIEETIVKSIAP